MWTYHNKLATGNERASLNSSLSLTLSHAFARQLSFKYTDRVCFVERQKFYQSIYNGPNICMFFLAKKKHCIWIWWKHWEEETQCTQNSNGQRMAASVAAAMAAANRIKKKYHRSIHFWKNAEQKESREPKNNSYYIFVKLCMAPKCRDFATYVLGFSALAVIYFVCAPHK